MQIAIVVSEFNEPVTSKLLTGALAYLKKSGVETGDIEVTKVPGAVEIPLIAKQYAQELGVSAVICLGAVIKGETDHFDYVCQQVSYGCQKIALETDVPVIFGILTTQTAEQAFDRVGGKKGHKGEDAAKAALSMIEIMNEF